LIIREIAPGASFIMVGLLTAFPALLGAAAMLLWSHSSDQARRAGVAHPHRAPDRGGRLAPGRRSGDAGDALWRP